MIAFLSIPFCKRSVQWRQLLWRKLLIYCWPAGATPLQGWGCIYTSAQGLHIWQWDAVDWCGISVYWKLQNLEKRITFAHMTGSVSYICHVFVTSRLKTTVDRSSCRLRHARDFGHKLSFVKDQNSTYAITAMKWIYSHYASCSSSLCRMYSLIECKICRMQRRCLSWFMASEPVAWF